MSLDESLRRRADAGGARGRGGVSELCVAPKMPTLTPLASVFARALALMAPSL